MRRVAGAVVVLALGLGACSSGEEDPDAAPSSGSEARPTSVVRPTQDPATARLQALARLAESAAAELPPAGRAPAPRTGEVVGADAGWPQCPRGMGIPERRTLGRPMPVASAEYVVLGLTNGPGFTANPCLADQVRWARERRVLTAAYAVASLPDDAAVARHGSDGPYDGATTLGALANAGYQQALANVVTMRRAGASPVVWVDVEPVPDFEWSGDPERNAAVVEGAVRGYRYAGYRVGVYSTPTLWRDVVGDLALGVPEWRAAGQTSRAEARARCGDDWSIQGGRAVLAQWVEDGRDRDLTCPGTSAELGRWFARS